MSRQKPKVGLAVRVSSVVLSVTVTLVAGAPAAWAVVADITINGKTQTQFDVGQVTRGVISSGYSLHAGAQVNGAPTPTMQILHDPAQTGARDTTYPIKYTNTYQGPGRELTPTPGPAFSRSQYASKPYFTGAAVPNNGDTDFAHATGTNAAGNGSTEALARETVALSIFGISRYQTDTTGSTAKLTKTGTKPPAGKAGAIMVDPWNFGPSLMGNDALTGGLTLSGDLHVNIDDPNATAAVEFNAASNLITSLGSPDPLGNDDNGNPLIYSLLFSFHAGTLMPDIAFTGNGSYQFFAPTDTSMSSPISGSSLQSFVSGEILSDLDFVGPNEFTLKNNADLSLFLYRGTSVANVDNVQVDMLHAVDIETVPEPGTLILALLGIGGLIWVRHRPISASIRPER